METRQRVAHYASIATCVLVAISYFADQLAEFIARVVPA